MQPTDPAMMTIPPQVERMAATTTTPAISTVSILCRAIIYHCCTVVAVALFKGFCPPLLVAALSPRARVAPQRYTCHIISVYLIICVIVCCRNLTHNPVGVLRLAWFNCGSLSPLCEYILNIFITQPMPSPWIGRRSREPIIVLSPKQEQ